MSCTAKAPESGIVVTRGPRSATSAAYSPAVSDRPPMT